MTQQAMKTKIAFLRSRLQSESGKDFRETEEEIKELEWRLQKLSNK